MLRLLHLADIHPDSNATFAGKVANDPQTGKNLFLTDLSKSLEFAYNAASQHRCDAVVIPGDTFNSVDPDMDEVGVILSWLVPLAEEVQVIITPGNHDLAVSPNMATALEPLRWRSNIHVIWRPYSILLNIKDQLVRFHCLPYPTKGRLLQQAGMTSKSPEETTAIINHALASILRGFKAELHTDGQDLNVLLAHGSVAHCKVGDQPRSLAHDILLPVDEFEGFDYVALGHIHQQQQVAPNAWYSGSLMRNGFGEEYEPKGFNLVEVRSGQQPVVTFIENPHARAYTTFGYNDLLSILDEGGFSPNKEHVWRFKASLTPDQYQFCKPYLERWQQETPYFQQDIEIATEDRARDAGIAQCLTTEDALDRVLTDSVPDADRQAIFAKHAQLLEEVNA